MQTYSWISTIKLNLIIFKLIGLWPKDDGYKFNIYTIHGILTIFFFGFIQSFCQTWKLLTNFSDLQVVTQTAFLSISESLVVLKMLYLALNIRSFKKLIQTLKSEVFQPTNLQQIELIKPDFKIWKLMYNLLGGFITVAIIFWAAVPILTQTFKQKRLPFVAWYPFDTKFSPLYEITYFHQVASILFLAYINVNLDTFIAAFSLYAGAQLDILCDDLKTSTAENLLQNLINCVRRHREIINFVQTYNNAFNWIIFMQFFTSTISLGLTMFLLTVVESFSSEFYSFLFYGNAVLLEIFIYCWFGNQLEVKSGRVFFIAFESQWIDAPLEAQKNLLFFMMRTQTPLKISALNLFDLTLENFLKMLKTAYSYFALVSRLNSNESRA